MSAIASFFGSFASRIIGTEIPDTTTANGAPSFSDTKGNVVSAISLPSEVVDFFYFVTRGISDDDLRMRFNAAYKADRESTLRLLFNLRDCRKGNPGKGERKLFYLCIDELVKSGEKDIVLKNIAAGNIEHFGYFKDLVNLSTINDELADSAIERLAVVLASDLDKFTRGDYKDITLAAKWAPTERCSFDTSSHTVFNSLVERFAIASGYTNSRGRKKHYRKSLSTLRKHIDVVERVMCNGDWSTIDFSKVPSHAMKNYRKAFNKHCKEHLAAFLERVTTGESKINAGALTPYDLVVKYRYQKKVDAVLEAQWTEFVKKYKDTISNSVAIVDVSGSMLNSGSNSNIIPMDVAISLGIMIAECGTGSFKNKFITFSSDPTFCDISGALSLHKKIQTALKSSWGMTTDFYKVHKLIVEAAVENKVPQSEFPERIFVFSDMQFDNAMNGDKETMHASIKKLYESSDYKLPQMVYWNLNGSYNNVHVKSTWDNVVLVSGASPSVIAEILKGNIPTPESLVRNLANHEAYTRVVLK